MITLSACIEMMFREEPDFLKRIDLAADCGFRAVEFWGAGNKDIDGIKARAEARGVAVSVFGGPGGTLGDPATHADLVRAMRETIPLANKLGTRRLILTVGNEIEGMSRATQHANIVAGLKQLAPVVEDAGITLCVEPLNILVDHMGYYLATSADALEMVDESGTEAAVRHLPPADHRGQPDGEPHPQRLEDRASSRCGRAGEARAGHG